jgi:ankyrin repeat protein
MRLSIAIALIVCILAYFCALITRDLGQSKKIIEAAKNGDAQYLEKFFASGGSVRFISDENGRTPLIWAAWNGHRDVVRLLLKNGARVNQEDDRDENDYGRTALGFATGTDVGIVEDLIEAGADVHCRAGQTNMTCLMQAVAHRKPEIVKCFLRHGADVHARCKKGSTALSIAKYNKDTEIIEILEAAIKEQEKSK